MSILERATSLLLGRRIDPPSGLPPGTVPDGVVLRQGRLLPGIGGLLGRMGAPAAAVTLRSTIVLHPDVPLTRELLVHELTHVEQWRDPLFPLRYTLASLRHGYTDNPYEVAARRAAAPAASPPPPRLP
jgi:hypothetical protein